MHINRTSKLTKRYMKNSQVNLIHQYQIQYYDYNTNEKSRITFSKIHFIFPFLEQQRLRYLQTTMREKYG